MAIQLIVCDRVEIKRDPIVQPMNGACQWWVLYNGSILAYCDTELEAKAIHADILGIRERIAAPPHGHGTMTVLR